MVVVHRSGGFRFVIYTQDHVPAHVHVTGPGQAKIKLIGQGGLPELVFSVGIGRADMRRLMGEAVERRAAFLAAWESIMEKLSDGKLTAAATSGRVVMRRDPRAESARYDSSGRIVVELVGGCATIFPASLVQDLQGASAEDLAGVEVDGAGFNLSWPALGVDLYVPALVAGIFGTRAWIARKWAGEAGRTRGGAKAAAARANGAKGGGRGRWVGVEIRAG